LTSWELRGAGYTLLQISNPLWTLWECCWSGVPIVGPVLVVALPAAAMVVWLLNLPTLADELKQTWVPKPPRVAEDDEQVAAQAAGPPPHISPWD
jgi:hypothetical protein